MKTSFWPRLTPVSSALRDAVRFSLALQVPLLLLSGFVADYGDTMQMVYITFMGFNVFLFMVLLRRRRNPTKMDLMIIRGGFVPAIFGTYAMAFWMCRLV